MITTQKLRSVDSDGKKSTLDELIEVSDSHKDRGEYEQARTYLKRAILMGEQSSEIYHRLGYIDYCRKEYRTAFDYCEQALALNKEDADAHRNLGLLYLAKNDFRSAAKHFLLTTDCLKLRADAELNLASLALVLDDYPAGWHAYRTNLNVPLKSTLSGKSILVRSDINIWQELFFLRFLPDLIKNGAKKVSYFTKNDAQFSLLFDGDKIELLKLPAVESHYDLVFPLVDLPKMLIEPRNETLPKPLKFSPFKQNVNVIKNLLPNNDKENIAVTWESFGPDAKGLHVKISPLLLGESLRFSNANILVLQDNPSQRDIRLLEKGLRRKVFNYSFVNESLESASAFLSEVDHFVSAGDHNLHLIASFNKKVSVMVAHPPQWQWLLTGQKTPWFPGFDLYRQDISGSWEQACENLKLSLAEQGE